MNCRNVSNRNTPGPGDESTWNGRQPDDEDITAEELAEAEESAAIDKIDSQMGEEW